MKKTDQNSNDDKEEMVQRQITICKKVKERNRKYKIIGREVATVHNITPWDAFKLFFFISLTSIRNRSSSLQKSCIIKQMYILVSVQLYN